MRRGWLAGMVGLYCALGACAGCRLFTLTAVEGVSLLSPEQERRLLIELQADQWVVDRHWSPLNEGPELSPEVVAKQGARSSPPFRWTHTGESKLLKSIEQTIAPSLALSDETLPVTNPEAARGGTEDEPPSAASSPSGRNRSQQAAARNTAINAALLELVGDEGPAGWNATVWLTQRNTSEVIFLVDRLEWLVTQREPSDLGGSPWPWLVRRKPRYTPPADKTRQVPLPLRAAAAEAWCALLVTQKGDLETVLEPAALALGDESLPRELRRELWRSIARHVPPERIPALPSALAAVNSPPVRDKSSAGKTPVVPQRAREIDDRRAAAEACLLYAVHHPGCAAAPPAPVSPPVSDDNALPEIPFTRTESPWPPEFWDLEHETDPQVRRSFGLTLAFAQEPQALRLLVAQISDQEPLVRDAALLGLGRLGTPAALEELKLRMKKGDESFRRAALRGLGQQGPASLAPYAADGAVSIRVEVVRQLGKYSTAESARVLRTLLLDKNLEVQGAVLTAIETWPAVEAIPLLLESLSQSSLRTRRLAIAQLERHRGTRLQFPVEGDPSERAQIAQHWAREWQVADPLMQNLRELSSREHPRAVALRQAELRERLQQLQAPGAHGPPSEAEVETAAQGWARQLREDDLPALEALLAAADGSQSQLLLDKVLPKVSPAYAALRQLDDTEINVRRRGARALLQQGEQASLSVALIRRLSRHLQTEQDRLVWRFCMQAVARDGSEEAAALAQLAIHSVWPDVRILGCEYIGAHARPQQAVWIIPLFGDENHGVRLAAVTAAGRCRNPLVLDGGRVGQEARVLPGLRQLLHTTQGELRYQTTLSMASLGDDEAVQELIRLGYDANPIQRLEVARAMGQTGQTRFIEPLIRLGWTEQNPNVRNAVVKSLEWLVPVENRPVVKDHAHNLQQTIEIWAAWWEDQASGWHSAPHGGTLSAER